MIPSSGLKFLSLCWQDFCLEKRKQERPSIFVTDSNQNHNSKAIILKVSDITYRNQSDLLKYLSHQARSWLYIPIRINSKLFSVPYKTITTWSLPVAPYSCWNVNHWGSGTSLSLRHCFVSSTGIMPGKWLVPSEACEWLSECLLLLLSWSDLPSFFNTLSTSNSLLNHGLGICNPQLAGIFSSRSLHVEENPSHPSGPRHHEEIMWSGSLPLSLYPVTSFCMFPSQSQFEKSYWYVCLFLIYLPLDGKMSRSKSCLLLIEY